VLSATSFIHKVSLMLVGWLLAIQSISVAFNEDNVFIYVANQGSNIVYVIAPLTTTFSDGCNGTFDNAGQTATCTVTNAYGR
jgi:DNA-binding beta-propeller fold protein YncE